MAQSLSLSHAPVVERPFPDRSETAPPGDRARAELGEVEGLLTGLILGAALWGVAVYFIL